MADDYVQSLLADGETVRSEASQHPIALIRFALQPILVLIAAAVCFAIGDWLKPDGEGLFGDIVRWVDTLLGLLTAGLFILAIVWLPLQAFRWTKRRYLVTDRRVLYVEGVLRRNSADAGLSMITDVAFRQGFLGRKLGYGDLVVATAASRPLDFRQIRGALDFKKTIMSAQQGTVEARAAEILIGRGIPPAQATAAVGTAPVATAPVAVTAAAATPAAPTPPPVPAWDGTDVPQMHEDDTPALDPAVLGADAPAAGPVEAVAVTTEATETVEATAADTADEATDVAEEATETVEATAADTADEATDVAEEATETVEATAADTADEATDVAEEATETVEATAADTADEATDVAEEATETVEDTETVEARAADTADEATDVAEEATETVEATAASHVDALESIDSTVGGLTDEAKDAGADTVTAALASLADERDSGAITAEEFEAREQEFLDRL